MNTQTESTLVYRPNIAFILENPVGQVLIGERRDIPGSWQFPQGGVAETESLEEALHREVEEEILLPPSRSLKGPIATCLRMEWRDTAGAVKNSTIFMLAC